MLHEIFILTLALTLAALFYWGFKTLPKEQWQILGCIPTSKREDGGWNAMNLTYYGFFTAMAYSLAVALFFLLMGSLALPLIGSSSVLMLVLGICMPASRVIAAIVERKKHTFTVGGAFFAGLLAAPAAILLVNKFIGGPMGFDIPVLSMLAGIAIAYAIGEGVGRLACISFGCCYGKPLSACPSWMARLFARWHFVFSGETKKIAYAHHLQGQEVIPIQAMTAILYGISGLLGCYLFLEGFAGYALIETLVVTQGWRTISEFFRADYRGTGRVTAYQIMALTSMFFAFFLFFLLPDNGRSLPDLTAGLQSFWDPAIILGLGVVWMGSFLYTGRSRVTGAIVQVDVRAERI